MKITEPIFIKKMGKRGYRITGSVPGYGTIERYGFTEEEAKEKFFEACNTTQSKAFAPRAGRRAATMGRA